MVEPSPPPAPPAKFTANPQTDHTAEGDVSGGTAAEGKVSGGEANGGGTAGIRDLIFKLEEEAEAKHQHQLRAMEAQIAGREQQIGALKGAIAKLKDDFEYNLQLIASRDDELAQYDASVAEMQETMRLRDVALSDAQIALAEKTDAYGQLESKCKELEIALLNLQKYISSPRV